MVDFSLKIFRNSREKEDQNEEWYIVFFIISYIKIRIKFVFSKYSEI